MEVLKGENRTCGGLFSQANPSGKLALSICNPSWHLLVALPRMDYLADHNPSPSFRVKPGHEQMGRRLDWSTTVGGQIAAGIQASRAREAHTRKIYIYIYLFIVITLEAIHGLLIGWRPSLAATRKLLGGGHRC